MVQDDTGRDRGSQGTWRIGRIRVVLWGNFFFYSLDLLINIDGIS